MPTNKQLYTFVTNLVYNTQGRASVNINVPFFVKEIKFKPSVIIHDANIDIYYLRSNLVNNNICGIYATIQDGASATRQPIIYPETLIYKNVNPTTVQGTYEFSIYTGSTNALASAISATLMLVIEFHE